MNSETLATYIAIGFGLIVLTFVVGYAGACGALEAIEARRKAEERKARKAAKL